MYIGIDLGTSGCRAVAIDAHAGVIAEARAGLPEPDRADGGVEQDPAVWWQAVLEVLTTLLGSVDPQDLQGIAVDGTSGTVLVTDESGAPLAPALMYNDNRTTVEAARVADVAPRESAAHGTGAGLAKALWLLERAGPEAARIHTQADWIEWKLGAEGHVSDANNVLKLGWDPIQRDWPEWIRALGLRRSQLPGVVAPGTPVGSLHPHLASAFDLPWDVPVVAGTTDSTAAILATGIHVPGDAVTSLGSTLVTKVVADRPVFAPEYGVYSQPLGRLWLVGGGSNTGGAVLGHFFSPERMAELSARMDPSRPTGLDFYPLLAPGERFPVNDPTLRPRLEPQPADDVLFFQGMLEGMAAIERSGYERLKQLGAPYPRRVLSVGGGALNEAWTVIRARVLGVPLERPRHSEACYGTALLAAFKGARYEM